jgi:hypothetical protein
MRMPGSAAWKALETVVFRDWRHRLPVTVGAEQLDPRVRG